MSQGVQVTAKATLSADGGEVTHSKGAWSESYPVRDLPGRLAFYRAMRDRNAPRDRAGVITGPGPYAASYEDDVRALERVEKMARVMGGIR